MIRYLKVLLGAALALSAFGVLSASAHAAEERFHCSVEPCTATLRQDGASGTKTAHQVFEVTDGKNAVFFTCNKLTGEATSTTKTTNTLTFKNLEYNHNISGEKCDTAGQNVNVTMSGCEYHVIGTPPVAGVGKAHLTVKCPAGKSIEVENESTKCIYTIGTTANDLTGLSLHNIGVKGGGTTEVTVEAFVPNIPVTVLGTKAQCGVDPTAAITGTYSTGNVIVTGETDPKDGSKPVMAEAWYE